ncbi:N-acetylmuramoyl-L-alanine amidase [Ectobacillus antri]|jgi:N-acetylmuramoyl-L-alanine amidase|uniref:N-acetylmuramoyl-L-alanine amidase n=1 Tax=Ectobacillus antri TaxID=2486280 RepID=A0ABT6H2L4_9BACI|nr:N-acetylmuramoyl-L-alanine amidase [Ectobacillus antri]MDG4655686.1 N-acetylmuramoyl-L-alanine amidase [Ectobacillus antri]MDG5753444.1 N-acetylmuramoyl-L-alanine amidase [Ectobacillus antri]
MPKSKQIGIGLAFVLMLIIGWRWYEEKKVIIVLDPGHGGSYPGFEQDGVLEKDIVLEVSQYVRTELQNKGYTVYLTREGDQLCEEGGYLKDLACRPKLSRKKHADVFVSIHANGFKDSNVRGAEVYYFTPFRDKQLAEKIGDNYIKETKMPLRYVKFGNYKVLRETLVPSALVEIGYLTNKEDMKLLMQDDFKRKSATGIALGIEEFLRNQRK